MAPKKAGTSKPKAASSSAHASYQDMIKVAILNLKDRKGSSRQAIKKYVQANNNLGNTTDAQFSSLINRALTSGEEAGVFSRPKGPSGPVKLQKPATAADKSAATKSTAAKPAAAKKTTAAKAKKPAAEKKPKVAAKKTAAPKANTGASRKPAPAPAVEDKPAVLGKTKSGRVTKNKAPPAGTKKATPKKTATKAKKPAAKKATPKKEEAKA